MFYGNLAIVEQSFSINSFLATSLRLSSLTSLCLYICFSIKQLKDGKILQILIANGLSRNNLIVAVFLNFFVISLVFCLLSLAILTLINFTVNLIMCFSLLYIFSHCRIYAIYAQFSKKSFRFQ